MPNTYACMSPALNKMSKRPTTKTLALKRFGKFGELQQKFLPTFTVKHVIMQFVSQSIAPKCLYEI